MRFTLISWVRWHAHSTEKGATERLARSVGLSKSAFNRWLHAGPLDADNLRRLRTICDEVGSQGPLDRWYATQDDFQVRYQPQADPRWWDELGRYDRFRGPVDVLVTADAGIARFRPSESDSPPPPQRDQEGIDRIALALCRVQSGPYGKLANEGAYTRLATLLPWCVDVVERFCTDEVTGFIVARSVDRGLRLYPGNPRIADCAQRLVDRFVGSGAPTTRPTTIPLRLARRLARKSPDDYGRSVLQRLEHVAREDGDPCARRAAFWYIHELAPEIDASRVRRVRTALRDDPELRTLAAWLDDHHPQVFQASNWDAVAIAGRVTDSPANEAILHDLVQTSGLPSQLRVPLTNLLLDLLTSPCSVRVRTIANVLASASPDVVDHASARFGAVLDRLVDDDRDHGSVHLAARAASRAGIMRNAGGRGMPNLVRALDSPHTAVVAIAAQTVGDVLLAVPTCAGADAARRKLYSLAGHTNEAVGQSAVYSLAVTSDPRLEQLDVAGLPATTVPWVRWGLWLRRRDGL